VSTLAAPNSDPPVNNSVVDPNPNPKPNPSANAGTQSLTINNSQMTPGQRAIDKPIHHPGSAQAERLICDAAHGLERVEAGCGDPGHHNRG
jgi:hypothetical protein